MYSRCAMKQNSEKKLLYFLNYNKKKVFPLAVTNGCNIFDILDNRFGVYNVSLLHNQEYRNITYTLQRASRIYEVVFFLSLFFYFFFSFSFFCFICVFVQHSTTAFHIHSKPIKIKIVHIPTSFVQTKITSGFVCPSTTYTRPKYPVMHYIYTSISLETIE